MKIKASSSMAKEVRRYRRSWEDLKVVVKAETGHRVASGGRLDSFTEWSADAYEPKPWWRPFKIPHRLSWGHGNTPEVAVANCRSNYRSKQTAARHIAAETADFVGRAQ